MSYLKTRDETALQYLNKCVCVCRLCVCAHKIVRFIPVRFMSLLFLFLPPSGMLFASTCHNPARILKPSDNATFSEKASQILQIHLAGVATALYCMVGNLGFPGWIDLVESAL